MTKWIPYVQATFCILQIHIHNPVIRLKTTAKLVFYPSETIASAISTKNSSRGNLSSSDRRTALLHLPAKHMEIPPCELSSSTLGDVTIHGCNKEQKVKLTQRQSLNELIK